MYALLSLNDSSPIENVQYAATASVFGGLTWISLLSRGAYAQMHGWIGSSEAGQNVPYYHNNTMIRPLYCMVFCSSRSYVSRCQ